MRLKGVAVEVATEPDGAGPVGAFDRVYAQQYPTLVRLAYLTTGDLMAAEDLAQDAYAELLRRWDRVRDPVPYLRRAVVSRCTSWVRRRMLERRHRRTHPATAPEPAGPPDADTAAVRAALVRLAPRQRAAVFLRYYLDLPEAQIAAALGCRPGTVKSLLHRSLAVLREHLDGH